MLAFHCALWPCLWIVGFVRARNLSSLERTMYLRLLRDEWTHDRSALTHHLRAVLNRRAEGARED